MKGTHPSVEVCANSVESAMIAQQAGASRVELCASMPEGGVTPSFGAVQISRQLLTTTRLHIMIRPRGGDFLYNPREQEIMLRDISVARYLGVDGVVFGCLTIEGNIDIPLMKRLLNAADGMDVTFHRAFDVCSNPRKALGILVDLGIHRVLTSGQESTAEKGIPLLKELVKLAKDRIVVMPGCGVNASNIRKIAEETGANEFHLSGRSLVDSGMSYRNANVSISGASKIGFYCKEETNFQKVQAAIRELESLHGSCAYPDLHH